MGEIAVSLRSMDLILEQIEQVILYKYQFIDIVHYSVTNAFVL